MHKTKSELKREAQDETQRIEGEEMENLGEQLTPAMPDGKPFWESTVREQRAILLPDGRPPHGTFHRVTITEETNDKDWMHRNMDLADLGTIFNTQFEKLWQFAALFAVGMVMMGGLIWILAAN